MIRDDFLLRQVRLLAALLARLLGRATPAEQAEAESECAGLVGLDLDVAGALPPDTLLALLRTADGLDAERCLALGLGLAFRAVRLAGAGPGAAPDPATARLAAARLATTAGTLIATALAARPALDNPDVQAVLAALAAHTGTPAH
ncbi:MAG: hypothetical protein Q8P41_31025 [Pseudomonadota bacterium]|nr:hypothetical protein [Pseudomonadota bacterium]